MPQAKDSEGVPGGRGAALVEQILSCPDCNIAVDSSCSCSRCGRSFTPQADGIIDAMPATMQAGTRAKTELQRLIDSAGPGEHGERVVLYEQAFHDEQAPSYDELFVEPQPTASYYRRLVGRQIFSYVRHAPFLVDLCCGTGKSSLLLVEKGMVVVGMDVSREMLRAYKKKCDAKGYQDVVLVHADASRPPLRPGSCAAITLIGGLHHIQDQAGCLETCRDALRDGGFLALHEPLQTGRTSGLAKVLRNLYALADPARVGRSLARRLKLRTVAAFRPPAQSGAPAFTPYEKPFTSSDALLAILPPQLEPILLRSQGYLSFHEFSPPLQRLGGAALAALIVRLDEGLSAWKKGDWSGDAIFALFQKTASARAIRASAAT